MATQEEKSDSELPPAQRHIIKRPRLTRLLDEVEARVIMLVAPAGYGKTTLAREWLRTRRSAGTSIRVRPQCKDAPVLARTLLHSLTLSMSDEVASSVEGAIAAGAPPDELAEVLVEAIGDDDRLVVIDDHHNLDGAPDAERLLGAFVRASELKFLITSRSRPSWIRARDLLYGAVVEVDRSALAMDLEEARHLLRSRTPKEVSELLATSRGWPAVLGLSAFVANPQIHASAPEALYDYFAQELVANLSTEDRTAFGLLSLLDRVDDASAEAVVGLGAPELIRIGLRAGILTGTTGDEVEIHPLLRQFLRERHASGVPDEVVRSVVAELTARQRWDEAFALVSSRGLDDQIGVVVAAGIEPVLREGRLTTLQQWTRWSRRRGLNFPELIYAEAELAIRRGDHLLAQSLATNAAADMEGRMRTRALLCAGVSAHMRDDNRLAYDLFERARSETTEIDLEREAIWGLFLAALELPDKDPLPLLNHYAEMPNRTPAHILRVHQGRFLVAPRIGDLRDVVDSALAALPLADAVTDPFIRTAFLHALAHDCSIAARYSLAKTLAERTIAESRRFRLAFAIPHALLDLALAQLGMGEATAAEASVELAANNPHGRHDSHLQAYCSVLAARIELARRNPRRALEICELELADPPKTFVTSELNATAALASASARDALQSRQYLNRLSERASSPESRGTAVGAHLLITILEDGDVRVATDRFVQEIDAIGALDCALTAMRTDRHIGSALLRWQPDWTTHFLDTVKDSALASELGLKIRQQQSVPVLLSKRETDVLDLVAEGLTSRQIGDKLFIAEKTVKAHLARIYGKLGVHSRTQAVVKARELTRGV